MAGDNKYDKQHQPKTQPIKPRNFGHTHASF